MNMKAIPTVFNILEIKHGFSHYLCISSTAMTITAMRKCTWPICQMANTILDGLSCVDERQAFTSIATWLVHPSKAHLGCTVHAKKILLLSMIWFEGPRTSAGAGVTQLHYSPANAQCCQMWPMGMIQPLYTQATRSDLGSEWALNPRPCDWWKRTSVFDYTPVLLSTKRGKV